MSHPTRRPRAMSLFVGVGALLAIACTPSAPSTAPPRPLSPARRPGRVPIVTSR